jgi:hypothetical protein
VAVALEVAEQGGRGLLEGEDQKGRSVPSQLLLQKRATVLKLGRGDRVGTSRRTLDDVGEADAGEKGRIVLTPRVGLDHASPLKALPEAAADLPLVIVAGGDADRRGIDPDADRTQVGPQEVGECLYLLALPTDRDPMMRVEAPKLARCPV